MGRKYKVISADGHLETAPDRWIRHVPDKYRHRAPRLVDLEDGGQGWLVEGLPLVANGVNLTGQDPLRYSNVSYWDAEGNPRPGTGGPEQRLTEQDRDGIDAEVLYPPIYASRFFESIGDRRVYLALIRAYNDFVAEFCSVAPDRLLGNAIIPSSGIDDALVELKRCKEIGLRAVAPIQWPNGGGNNLPAEDDRFWALAMELDLKLSPHVQMGERVVGAMSQKPIEVWAGSSVAAPPRAVAIAHSVQSGPMWCLIQMISSGTFDRFPELRFYFAESQAGWLPFQLFAMDEAWRRRQHLYPEKLPMQPSEYVRRHALFGIVCDPIALRLRDFLPAQNIMWGSDFPHSNGSFPDSAGWLGRIFGDVPDDLRRKVLLENPADFFGLDLDADITETPTTVGAVSV